MDVETARWLVSPEAADALTAAAAEPDPASLAAATRLRRTCTPDQAAAALAQESLRRKARDKFGERAAHLFFTSDGLQQATRPAVAAWRAARFAAVGVTDLVDIGCGIGSDALAFAESGIAVTPVEIDPVVAVLAEANLHVPVIVGDGEALTPGLLRSRQADAPEDRPEPAVFIDPSRRTARGRTWRVEDFRPSWTFVLALLDGSRPACAKFGPGLPLSLIPDHVQATWVSERGDVVEVSLWAGPWSSGRHAVVLPDAQIEIPSGRSLPAAGALRRYVYEPDGAVIRAGGVPLVASLIDGHPLDPHVAYLTSDVALSTPLATCFEVLDVLAYDERSLRAWVRSHRVGTLDIKKRGIEVDPAVLRRRLKPAGPNAATVILTPSLTGTLAVIVRRVG